MNDQTAWDSDIGVTDLYIQSYALCELVRMLDGYKAPEQVWGTAMHFRKDLIALSKRLDPASRIIGPDVIEAIKELIGITNNARLMSGVRAVTHSGFSNISATKAVEIRDRGVADWDVAHPTLVPSMNIIMEAIK